MKRLAGIAWTMLLIGCGPTVRTYDVRVNQEEVCRTFGGQPESCGRTTSPALDMQITIEDRRDGLAIIYGRSDTSSERTYLAEVPRAGRYEVVEDNEQVNVNTGCRTTTRYTLVLDVDDRGLGGGEETRIEEDRKCNDFNERRVTRRLKEWAGSRAAGDGDSSPLP